ncbi:methyl-accepting chemotaxis protein [Geobacter sp. FeAm09]|uniref:methyl-accepting chemotaxis protein n=1 Tax=Geobacter sp. FeAm09 TaxID=2597769 RepID=UPI0011EE6A1C|nr:methyl-accepting chemotaxis protein [Geobacter sp. FeAm09]QEM69272.1 methyl-accepting chemotaxis protein [Geobacter sp. FeAm09]
MFSNLKIGTRLALGFSVMLLLMVVISGIAMTSFGRMNKKVDVITDDRWPKAVLLNEINNHINVVARSLRNAVILSDPAEIKKELQRIDASREAVTNCLEKLARTITGSEGKAMLQAIRESRAAYAQAQKEIISQIEADNKAEAGQALITTLRPLQKAYFDAVGKMIEYQARELVKAGDDVEKTYKGAEGIMIATLVVSLCAAGLIGFVITLSITAPLAEAVRVNRLIADGNLNVVVAVDRKDEIGQLNGSARLMVENLQSIIGHLAGTSDRVASAATQLHAASEQMATASEEVAAQAGTVATAGEEMAATSGDIAQNCNRAAEGAHQASSSAIEGAGIVKSTVDVMGRIAEKVQASARTVDTLGARSDQIGAIVGTIEDIADQTNLLALNAAIEAARAGDQGRGFAVVADEVRALAERTTKATKEISDMIKSIQSETKGAVGIMEEGVREVESGSAEAARSGAALQAILDQVNAVTMQVSQIATAAEEQTATTNEISNNIHQMSQVVQQTAQGAQETSASASGLSKLAVELKEIVAKFKLA